MRPPPSFLTLKRIGIAALLSFLFPPLFLVVIPLAVWVLVARIGGRRRTKSPSDVPLDTLSAPFRPLSKMYNYQFHAQRALKAISRYAKDDQVARSSLEDSCRDGRNDSDCSIIYAVGETTVKGILFAYVSPWGFELLEIDPSKYTQDRFPGVSAIYPKKNSAMISTSGTIKSSPETFMDAGVGYTITQIQCGAAAQNPGVGVVFRVTGTRDVGSFHGNGEVPYLDVLFFVGGNGTRLHARPEKGVLEWNMTQLVEDEGGVVDAVGEMAFVARIVHNPSGKWDDAADITPASPVVSGVIRLSSDTLAL